MKIMIPLSGSEWGIVRFPALDVSPGVKEARAPLPPARQVGGLQPRFPVLCLNARHHAPKRLQRALPRLLRALAGQGGRQAQ